MMSTLKIPTRRVRVALTAAVAATVLATAVLIRAEAAQRIRLSEISHIHGLTVDPRDSTRLFLATHHGVFLTSPDGTAERVSVDESDYMGFTPHPGDPGVLYASGHPAGGGNMGFIVSRDGGRSWQQTSPGANGPVDFHAMDVSAADPNTIYGLFGVVQVSRDGGESWQIAGSPPADTFDLAASALDPNLVYAATRDGLMVSRDAAKTWELTGPAGPATMVQVGPDGSVYAFVLGSGLLRAPAAALSWKTIDPDFGARVLLHLAIDRSAPDQLFAVTDDGGILASSDGGQSWTGLSS
jgi:photosystem II stability/assembly factor-like uncharacterized protein